MGCGCSNNRFAKRTMSGPRQVGALRPVTRTNKNIIAPAQNAREAQNTAMRNPQNIVQTGSNAPAPPRSPSGEHLEKRKIQQMRRNVVRKTFGK